MLTGVPQDGTIKRIVCNLLAVLSLVCLQAQTVSAQDKILLVNSGQDTIYQEYAELLRGYLNTLSGGRYATESVSLNRPDMHIIEQHYKLIITAGTRAAEILLPRETDTPLLATFIPSGEYHAGKNTQYRCNRSRCAFLFLDQPPARQMRFVRALFAPQTRLGIFHASDLDNALPDYRQQAQRHNIQLVPIRVDNSEALIDALQKSIGDIDVLLAHPDTRLINRNTAKGILLTSYYNRVPLLAYSSSFVNAGATAGLYSAPEDLARHAAETALQLLEEKLPSPHSAHPKYFRVEINTRVSDSLNLNLPSASKIQETLKNDEAR